MNGRPLRRAVQPTTATLRAAGSKRCASAQLRQSIARRHPPCPRQRRRSRRDGRRFRCARKRCRGFRPPPRRSRVSAMMPDMESRLLKAKRLPRMRSSGSDGLAVAAGDANLRPLARPHHHRARIELALPAFDRRHSSAGRPPAHGCDRPSLHRPPAGLREQQRRVPPERRENRVRRAARSPGRARSACPAASRMPPGTGGRSALRRTMRLRRVDARLAGSASRSRAHSASTSARISGQSYIGSAAMNSLMPISIISRSKDRRNAAPSELATEPGPDYSFGGSAGTGAVPSPLTLRARTRGRKARPGSGARRSTGCTTGSFGLEGIGFEQREIVRKDIAVVHRASTRRGARETASAACTRRRSGSCGGRGADCC